MFFFLTEQPFRQTEYLVALDSVWAFDRETFLCVPLITYARIYIRIEVTLLFLESSALQPT